MQDGIAPKNPLDVGIPSTPEIAAKVCLTAASDPNIDMVAWASTWRRETDVADMAPFRQLLAQTDKPIVAFGRIIQQLGANQLAAQQAAGIPFVQGLEPTLRALNGLWFHAARRGRVPAAPPPAPPSELSPATLDATLARYGIALPRSKAVANAAEAAAAAEAIGFPVALKLRSPDILHKTEAGGVALGLREPRRRAGRRRHDGGGGARRAAEGCASTAFWCRRWSPGSRRSWARAAIRSMAHCCSSAPAACWSSSPRTRRCGSFPSTAGDVTAMIDGLKLAQLLAGFRGRPAADRAALEAAALALGRFFLDHRGRIEDIEINPLMVREKRRGRGRRAGAVARCSA